VGMAIPFLTFGIAVASLVIAGFRSKRAFIERTMVHPQAGSAQTRSADREIAQHT
jgi:hypothetical protein